MADVRQRSSNLAAQNDIELADLENNSGNAGSNNHCGARSFGHRLPRRVHEAGESGRKGIHPFKFLKICFQSSSLISKFVNVLWPFVPAAIAVHFARPDLYRADFALNYIAMIPTANLIGFSGQELARKLPKVFGLSRAKVSSCID